MDHGVAIAPQVVSSLYVERGLTVVRYLSSPASADWPTGEVLAPSELKEKVQIVPAPGVKPGFLEGPGSCCVVVAQTAAVLKVSLSPTKLGGSLDAVVKVETLDPGRPESAPEGSETTPAPAWANQSKVRGDRGEAEYSPSILAHIARRGDVQVAPGDWIAGPSAPAPIEGLQLHPSDQLPQVEVQALVFGQQHKWTGWAPPGAFVGTRGQARPLVGIRCRLSGSSRVEWMLSAEANFLGAARQTREGSEIEFVGPFANDPLVGFRLSVRPALDGVSFPAENSGEPRVKIYRAGGVIR